MLQHFISSVDSVKSKRRVKDSYGITGATEQLHSTQTVRLNLISTLITYLGSKNLQ